MMTPKLHMLSSISSPRDKATLILCFNWPQPFTNGFSNMITIAHSQLNFPDPSNHPHLTFFKLSDGMSRDDLSLNFMDGTRKFNTSLVTPLHEFLSRMIQDLDELPCIIYDGLMYQTESVARGLKVPSLAMRTSSATDFLTCFSLLSLREEGLIPLPDSRLLNNQLPGLEPLRFKDLPVTKYSPLLDSFLQLVANICNLGSSTAIIFNTIDLLENSSLTKIQQLTSDTSCIEWLDKQASRSVLCISMGSLASTDKKDIIEMAWGLANSGQHFLWVIRPDSVKESKWMELLPDGFQETAAYVVCFLSLRLILLYK
ncbi:hypothetical protein ACFE04_014380 [Oxalis oulophora]